MDNTDREINEFFEHEFQQDADVTFQILEFDLMQREDINEVLDVLCAVSANWSDDVLLTSELERVEFFEYLRNLHDNGENIFHLSPPTAVDRFMKNAVEDAILAYGLYKVIFGDMQPSVEEAQIEDVILGSPITRLFEAVKSMHGNPTFWLSSLRTLMPKAKILGDSSMRDNEVLQRIHELGIELEVESDIVSAIMREESAAVAQAVEEFLPGELDFKQAVISALRHALIFRDTDSNELGKQISSQELPVGISHDVFTRLFFRTIELLDSTNDI